MNYLVVTRQRQCFTITYFAKNMVSDCTGIETIGYYLMVDDVAMIASVNKRTDTVICTGKELNIDARTLGNEYSYLKGWKYKCNDGLTSWQRKITAPGDYLLSVTNKDCFEDIYRHWV